jgi:hypothetical protein
LLKQLEPLAFHVLVPCCLHWEETILCVAKIQLRGEPARQVDVLVPVEMYEALPRARSRRGSSTRRPLPAGLMTPGDGRCCNHRGPGQDVHITDWL